MFTQYKIHLGVAKRILRECQLSSSLYAWVYSLLIIKELSNGNHKKMRVLSKSLIKRKLDIGYYWLAHSYFLCGEYLNAEKEIRYIKDFVKIPEVVFLYSDILFRSGRRHIAVDLLEQCALNNSRIKVWTYLSNLVESPSDYIRFENHIEKVRKEKDFLKKDLLFSQRVNAALRAGLSEIALSLAEEQKQEKIVKKIPTSKSTSAFFSDRLARRALKDLKYILESNNIPFFLISGTLLGCIREGKLLGHDKDIDVGVWDTYTYEQLSNLLGSSGYFYVVQTRTKHLVMLRHVNGITIDVFIHYREPNNYWHAGVKIKWNNSPFDLISREFLDDIYLIPKEYDRYLIENYGDWRIPKKQFDSAFDTPNMEVINEVEMQVYKLRNQE